MSQPIEHPISEKLIQKLRSLAAENGRLNYQAFIQSALYDPECGYYSRAIQRVGRNEDTDFYTSQSLGQVFGLLVVDAVTKLLKENSISPVALSDWTWVEVGYESDAGWWDDTECPFKEIIRIGPSDPIDISGQCIVFSNELFDAQPFHRLLHIEGQWRELGVDCSGPELKETILEEFSKEVYAFRHQLPLEVEEGYSLDLPLATRPLLHQLTNENWDGLFIALDYGKTWPELARDFPQGTARAYYKHEQSSNLLHQPGLQDITCHICWDWLKEDLEEAGFENCRLESQEAFFVKNAVRRIEQIVTAKAGEFDPQRQTLMHLIHPATMGQQFQVLSAYRGSKQGGVGWMST